MSDASMPPLGPPYVAPSESPPPPRYPAGPPEQWPVPPPVLPQPASSYASRRIDTVDRSRPIIAGAIAVVLAVVIGVLVAENTGGSSLDTALPPPPTTTGEAPTESTTTTTAPADDLDAVVLDIEQFVERERGLKFKQHITPTLADGDEFQRLLLADFDEERPGLLERQEVLTALGLIDPGTDVVEAERTLLDSGVVGFYDPVTKKLVVRGTEVTPYLREVLAHELTHALEDQWFDLDRPQLENAQSDESFAFLGLVEGSARRIEDAYLGSLPLDEQKEAATEEGQLLAQDPAIFRVPLVLVTLITAPYEDGPIFIDQLLANGGQARLDATFGALPTSSEQILHPQRFLDGDVPLPVAEPSADGTPSNTGVLGELLLREILFDSIPSAAQVERALTGWGGDTYVTWLDASGRTCLRDSIVGDTAKDTSELAESLQEWAQDHDATVEVPTDGPVTFTVCA